MPPRKNSKRTGKSTQSSLKVKTAKTSAELFRTFIQRICTLSLFIVCALLIYFVTGGNVQEVTGSRTVVSNENQSQEPIQYSSAKPIVTEASATPLLYVSEGTENAQSPEQAPDNNSNSTTNSTTDSITTPEADSNFTPVPTPVPESTPESTPESMPSSTPESTPASTPESTPSSTPESTPSSTPESTPVPVPASTPQDSVSSQTPPITPPLKYNSETTITGPDGKPRHGEVLVLEKGNQEPVRNQFGPAVNDFLELFDFSITPDWIEANWISPAIVGPLTTRGYRVPISTGPTPSDLVGSLTYYFDSHLELEKITFEGYTGDMDRLLISLKYFNLSKRVTSDPNALLYISEQLSDNRRSFLKSYYRLPNQTTNPNQRFWITLELYPPER